MPPAARLGDQHACPVHTGGPLIAGSATVKIGGQPAARVGDQGSCGAARDTVVRGAPTVFIEGRPAARSGDRCAHSGVIVTGLSSVIIGNDFGGASGSGKGGSGSGAGQDPGSADGATISGTPVSSKVVSALVALARQLAGAGGQAGGPGMLQAIATALEVAFARGDVAAVAAAISQLQQLMKPKDGADAEKKAEGSAAAKSSTPATGWQTEPVRPGEPPRTIAVVEGRIAVNGRFTGIHAISEFDLIGLQAAGRIETIVQRLVAASAAGRNCARVFCMYQNAGGRLSPRSASGYWTAVDSVVKRLQLYGMFAELVLFADCDVRADGSGGVMPSWADRHAFAREAGQALKGRPLIVCGMHDPSRNGAAAADDERLIDVMRDFQEASGGTVPFWIGDPGWDRPEEFASVAASQRTCAAAAASIVGAHERRALPREDRHRYRPWIDNLAQVASLRTSGFAGTPSVYYTGTIPFGAKSGSETDQEAALAASAVCAVNQIGFCYHHVASDDPAVPGLELARLATMIPQSPDCAPFVAGDPASPIAGFAAEDFHGGSIYGCATGTEMWAVAYATRLPKTPRVEWRKFTPEIVWRGDRVIVWRGSAT